MACSVAAAEVRRTPPAFSENAGARIIGLGDLFDDQLEVAKKHFNDLAAKKDQAGVDDGLIFRGPHAFEEMAASKGLDAIVIATPPYFHVQHLAAVVAGGKHVYVEKPIAVDIPGTRKALEIGKKAQGRLSLEVGFQIRSAPPFAELVRRIHAGDLGEIGSGEAHYFCPLLPAQHPDAPPPVARLRNWLSDRTLSGDIIVEQNIHAIDICNWVLQGHPLHAVGLGGRKGRPSTSDCYGNCSVTFVYPGDVNVAFCSKQFGAGPFDVNEHFFGTMGVSQSPYSGSLGIEGEKPWTWSDSAKPQQSAAFSTAGTFSDNLAQADAEKHKGFINSITSGQFHNQAELGVESSRSAMLGRLAMDLKRPVTWDKLLRNQEVFDPKLNLDTMLSGRM